MLVRFSRLSIRSDADLTYLTGLREIEETSQAHLTELLDTLQIAEERKAEVERQVVVLEQQIGELEASLAAAPSSQQHDTTELEETIKELSQQLEAKAAEVEDTDEKYMEVSAPNQIFIKLFADVRVSATGPQVSEAPSLANRAPQGQDLLPAARPYQRQSRRRFVSATHHSSTGTCTTILH